MRVRRAADRRSSEPREGRPLLPALVVLLLACAACASPGGPGLAPIDRFPNYTQPIRQISLRGGHLGWGGLEVGMTFRAVQLAIGSRLPSPGGGMKHDEMCDTYWADAKVLRQPLRLELGGTGETSHLKAIVLRLANPAGDLSTLDLERALHARFPDLEYVPSPHQKDLPESVNPRPLYRLARSPQSGLLWIDPGSGVYFGEVCVD